MITIILDKEGIVALFLAQEKTPFKCLMHLGLWDNKIGHEGMKAFLQAHKTNPFSKILRFDFENTHIEDKA